MSFTAEIHNDGLYGYFFRFICDEFVKNLKEHPELIDFTKNNRIPIIAKECYTADAMAEELKYHKGHLKKEDVKTALKNWHEKEITSTLGVFTEWDYRDGKLFIIRFTLQIRSFALCMDVCKNIHDIDLYKKLLGWCVKHEIGHMLDFMNTRHGLSVDEYDRLTKRDADDYNQYFSKFVVDNMKSPDDSEKADRAYYALAQERDANNAVGITVDEFIEISRSIIGKYKNKVMTLSIDTSNIRDIPEEKSDEE